jgi:Transmembrane secretion effector
VAAGSLRFVASVAASVGLETPGNTFPSGRRATDPNLSGQPPAPRSRRGASFEFLLAATGTSFFGDGLVFVAFLLLAVTLTSSPLLVAGVAMAGKLPWLVMALPAGAVADPMDRRRLLGIVEMLLVFVLQGLGLEVLTGHNPLAVLYLAFMVGALETHLRRPSWPAGAVGLSGDRLVDFHRGAVKDLPGGTRARVVSALSIQRSGCVLRCEVPAARPR